MVDTNPSGSVFSWERSTPLLFACRAPLKREVLRLDAYGRELFVSQTPELTAMADVVIDVAELATLGGREQNGEVILAGDWWYCPHLIASFGVRVELALPEAWRL